MNHNGEAGGPLGSYLVRGLRENPRGVGIVIAGAGIALFGFMANDSGALLVGLGLIAVVVLLSLIIALFDRRKDLSAGRPFSRVRQPAPSPTSTSSQDLRAAEERLRKVQQELRDHPRSD